LKALVEFFIFNKKQQVNDEGRPLNTCLLLFEIYGLTKLSRRLLQYKGATQRCTVVALQISTTNSYPTYNTFNITLTI
jgi:hypothetical protein